MDLIIAIFTQAAGGQPVALFLAAYIAGIPAWAAVDVARRAIVARNERRRFKAKGI